MNEKSKGSAVLVRGGYDGYWGELAAEKILTLPDIVLDRLPQVGLVIDGISITTSKIKMLWDAKEERLVLTILPFGDDRIAAKSLDDVTKWFRDHDWKVEGGDDA